MRANNQHLIHLSFVLASLAIRSSANILIEDDYPISTKRPSTRIPSPWRSTKKPSTSLPPSITSSRPTYRGSTKSPSPFASPPISSKPTMHPSAFPTTDSPSYSPTQKPTLSPSISPSASPTTSHTPTSTGNPSSSPTQKPTSLPSLSPSASPTNLPSHNPTSTPTSSPSTSPTSSPTSFPTTDPSLSPTVTPTSSPSTSPTLFPTNLPSSAPTSIPTLTPTTTPTSSPSTSPTLFPTNLPSSTPTSMPTLTPTTSPTSIPTSSPSSKPTSNPSAAPTSKRPNLVMIITDEHNYRTLSCYRDYLASNVGASKVDVWGDATRLSTPHIDTLAKEGALFSNFYTVAPLCTPSRASFMTGMYPASTGDSELNHGAMDRSLKTFAAILQEQRGYHTGYFGKWHLDGDKSPGWGDNGREFGFKENKYRFNRGHFKFIDEVNGQMEGYEIDQADLFEGRQSDHYTTDYLMDRGIEFMNRSVAKNEPFAMVISIPDPHGPNQNRWKYRNMFTDRYFKVPHTAKTAMSFNPAAPGWNSFNLDEVPLKEVDQYIDDYEASEYWQNHMQQYYGMVKCVDDNIGKLMNSIKRAGIDEDTIVVLTSDHGDLLFEHGKFNKGKPYDTSAGIPFLIRYPGIIPAGKVVETAYSSVDFAPTILSMMGVMDADVDFQGVDGSEELLNSELFSYNEEKIIISLDSGKTPIWAMAQLGNFKLVFSKGDVPWLYDLRRDPDEIYNYIDSYQHRKIQKKLQAALIDALAKYDIPLLWYSSSIYIDKPSCVDKRDVLPLSNGRLGQCKDIGSKINSQKCDNQTKIRLHCPVACKSCCSDTDGMIIVDENVFNSCAAVKAHCDNPKVASFCPVTCNKC